jgi:uncharacterized protein with HEPN domain
MRREALKYLYDVQQACRLLSYFVSGKSFEDYEADVLLRSGVERQLTIVGEDLNEVHRHSMTLLHSTCRRRARFVR